MDDLRQAFYQAMKQRMGERFTQLLAIQQILLEKKGVGLSTSECLVLWQRWSDFHDAQWLSTIEEEDVCKAFDEYIDP